MTIISMKLLMNKQGLGYYLTPKGEKYILRLASPGWRTKDNLVSEALWLEALSEDNGIGAPRVIPTRTGESVQSQTLPGIPGSRNITLFSYLSGQLLGCHLNLNNLFKMGQLFARLHIQGKEWKRPAGFSSHSFDNYLSRGEEDTLFSQEILINLPREKTELLYTVRERVELEYAHLDKNDLRVIHCDLWHDNIKLNRGELFPFDFEDTILGYRLHDIAMAMLDLFENTDSVKYPPLFKAFKEGYTSLLDWPEGNMNVLQAGRVLWQMNWVARFRPAVLEDALKEKMPLLMNLME